MNTICKLLRYVRALPWTVRLVWLYYTLPTDLRPAALARMRAMVTARKGGARDECDPQRG